MNSGIPRREMLIRGLPLALAAALPPMAAGTATPYDETDKSATNPNGTPIEVFDSIRAGVASNTAPFYEDRTISSYPALINNDLLVFFPG